MFNSKIIQQQEEEFYKLNEEINFKTKDLLSEIQQWKESQKNVEKLSEELQIPKDVIVLATEEDKEEKYKILDNCNTVNVRQLSEGSTSDCLSKLFPKNIPLLSHLNNCGSEKIDAKKDVSKYKVMGQKSKLNQSGRASSSSSSGLTNTTNLGQEVVLPFGIARHKSEIKLNEEEFDNNLIPTTLKSVGQEGITKFLTAKVKLLAEQLQVMQKEGSKQLQKIKELQNFKEKSVEEKDRLIQQSNAAKSVVVKFEQQMSNMSAQLQTLQLENGNLKKEVDSLKKEVLQKKNNLSAMELKLNRTLEEVDKLKCTLQHAKQEEKEIKENSRKSIEEYKNTIRKLEKQRVDLLNGFKKQLIVIENIRRQKCLIEAAKTLKCAEDDFNNFLECNLSAVAHRRDLITVKKS